MKRLNVFGFLFLIGFGETSLAEVLPVEAPPIEVRAEAKSIDPNEGFRFVAFGDQKTMWGEGKDFERLLDFVAKMDQTEKAPLFMLDTGDIVDKGLEKPEDFGVLAEYLKTYVPNIPYLVSVGNHELDKTNMEARSSVYTFLKDAVNDQLFAADRLYYSKQIGPIHVIFLDTNDFVYPGEGVQERLNAQLLWLKSELGKEATTTVVAMHHPFIQSAIKHQTHSAELWNKPIQDEMSLPEILIGAGVDLVLTGHVHSWESFKLERNGNTMWVVNSSGKPNLWIEQKILQRRMPRDWAQNHVRRKYKGLEEWKVTQLGYMKKQENQISVIDVAENGSLHVEVQRLNGEVLNEIEIPK